MARKPRKTKSKAARQRNAERPGQKQRRAGPELSEDEAEVAETASPGPAAGAARTPARTMDFDSSCAGTPADWNACPSEFVLTDKRRWQQLAFLEPRGPASEMDVSKFLQDFFSARDLVRILKASWVD